MEVLKLIGDRIKREIIICNNIYYYIEHLKGVVYNGVNYLIGDYINHEFYKNHKYNIRTWFF